MPTIRNQETIDIIAENYCTNGLNKSQALIDAEYSESYAVSGLGHRIYDNIRVKEAIAEKIAEIKVKTVATRQQRQQFWTDVYQTKTANMADRLRASELLGRSEADFTDKYQDTSDQQKELDEAEQVEARRLASIRLKQGIA